MRLLEALSQHASFSTTSESWKAGGLEVQHEPQTADLHHRQRATRRRARSQIGGNLRQG